MARYCKDCCSTHKGEYSGIPRLAQGLNFYVCCLECLYSIHVLKGNFGFCHHLKPVRRYDNET